MPDAPATAPTVDDPLLDVLRCPLTLSKLRREGDAYVAEVGGLRYPIKDGIPQMLVDEAALPEGVTSLEELKKATQGRRPDRARLNPKPRCNATRVGRM